MKTFMNSLLITLPLLSFHGGVLTSISDVFNTKEIVEEVVHAKGYEIHQDITMNTQGNSKTTFDNNALILPEFQLIGPCALNNNEKKIALLAYYTSKGVSIYSPNNATNIIKSYRCNGVPYEALVAPAEWTATRFRVLLPSNKRQRAIYEAFNSGDITQLSDDLFKGIPEPSSSAIRYSATETPASNVFNTIDTYLIWAKIPTERGSMNVLIRMREVTENANLSALKFDLAVSKG